MAPFAAIAVSGTAIRRCEEARVCRAETGEEAELCELVDLSAAEFGGVI